MGLKYTASIFFLALSVWATAQIDTARSKYGTYYFEGDEVVFEFDVRAYEATLRASDSTAVDFADLGILQVAVSGTFNNWSEEGWTMHQIDPYRYQLRKHLKDLKDAPNWQFKFVINGAYWTATDSMLKKQGVLGWYNLKNPNAPAPSSADTGNVLFRLKGYTQNKQVILTGTFNNWDETALKMRRVADGWELRLSLAPGVYEYKFIADGKWMEDPANREKRRNQYYTFNSVLRVTKQVRFDLMGFDDARTVILSGSFNDWNEKALKMRRTESGWTTEIPLVGGKHLYKFIVDGNWMTDPANPRTETTWDGYVNSVLLVR
ncbi:MAG: hypothetical protein DYG98_26160 [Haliscomenobacteraceae bacterium CHB4]|nr:1,4-alpha-glucan branching enzyme GlgB [Saprospiraceae bacterium]MCE7926546.1 hypothetical protein [Haliscomenobacteraceae bacterium CHB4]